jgi:flagellar basal-body rod protein FlgF
MATGNNLDVALTGSAVLGVTSADGQLAFTRRGDLRVNANGVLENGSGHLVRGKDGSPISAPAGLVITIESDGTVFGRDPAQTNATPPVALGTLMLRDASEVKLQRRPDGLFSVVGLEKGQDFPSGPNPTRVTAGALEGSNVNALDVMIKLLDQSRTFEQQINMIKEAKSNDESGASMMKAS